MDPHIEVLDTAAHDAGVAAGVAAAAAAKHPIHQVLRTCGVTILAAHMIFIKIEGLDSLSAFAQLNGDSDVTEMAKHMASRPIAAGRVILGTMHVKRIQALVFWVKDHDKRGLVAEPELWDEDVMVLDAMERKEAEHNYGKIDVGTINPGKCWTDHGWDSWQIAFTNKLNGALSAAQVPTINYIIRDEDPSSKELFFTEEEERRYQMPRLVEGQNFKHDNNLVYKMLKAACVNTDAWAWLMKHDPKADGRKA